MPLAHFVSEAKKHTPVLGKKPPIAAEALAEAPSTDERLDAKRQMAEISEGNKAATQETRLPAWKQCQYLKDLGERRLCTQYMSWCAMEKCQKKFMETDFFDFKRHLKGKKPIK